ncbi:kazrin-like isoform X2 [Tubulanus polymorphus]|uniref:kazrin-like isoform X2 n=1 Tax=Tubulanus polymorphus TaxID=672921 RepID=UPI003DA4DE53
MKGLSDDTQVKFFTMVEDNRHPSANIDSLLQTTNENIHELRQELDFTNKRLSELAVNHQTNGETHEENVDWQANKITNTDNELQHLRDENNKLQAKLNEHMKEIDELRRASTAASFCSQQPSLSDLKLELLKYQQELLHAKEALQAMKADRKRLKAEKVELLSQMKQLYGTLEDKESELRDFIRNFEQRMKDNDNAVKQLALEKEECEREKWQLLKRAHESTERALALKTDMDSKDLLIKNLQKELEEVKEHVSELQKSKKQKFKPASLSDTGFSSGTDVYTPSEEHLPPYTENPPHVTLKSDIICKSNIELRSNAVNVITNEGSKDNTVTAAELLDHSQEKKKRGSLISLTNSFGSLTRAFSRAKNRRSFAVDSYTDGENPSPCVSLICDDNVQEKTALAIQATELPITQWKAPHVLSWLEITLNMPRYGPMCASNIKSGKVLLEMSDSELDTAFKFTSHLHRRKIRLAIEELREPSNIKYPKISQIDNVWVSQVFLEDVGLKQYRSVFIEHLIDGRTLNSLSKKDLEKHVNIHRKFHHASILHAVELLRKNNFDKEALAQRRQECEIYNCDPLVWTNKRLIRWIETIDLGEYASNLIDAGVHGALMVLEPSFNADALAVALAIPPSKSHVHRHLTQEFDNLIKPARYALGTTFTLPGRKKGTSSGGSLGRAFERSFKGGGGDASQEGPKKRISFRGSLGRAFGRRTKSELAAMPEEIFMHGTNDQRSHSQEELKIGTAV